VSKDRFRLIGPGEHSVSCISIELISYHSAEIKSFYEAQLEVNRTTIITTRLAGHEIRVGLCDRSEELIYPGHKFQVAVKVLLQCHVLSESLSGAVSRNGR